MKPWNIAKLLNKKMIRLEMQGALNAVTLQKL